MLLFVTEMSCQYFGLWRQLFSR